MIVKRIQIKKKTSVEPATTKTNDKTPCSISGFFKPPVNVDEFEVSFKKPELKTVSPRRSTRRSPEPQPVKDSGSNIIRISNLSRRSTSKVTPKKILREEPLKAASKVESVESKLSTPKKPSIKTVKPSSRPVRRATRKQIADDSFEASDDDEFEVEIYDSEPELEQVGKKNKKKIVKNTKKTSINKPSKHKQKSKKADGRWERIKQILAAGGTVEALPGRIDEFDWIKRTVVGLLESSLGGCLCKRL